MATPSVTNTFVNSTTADAGGVNTNFQDLVNALTDGNNDLSIAALTCSGTATLNGSITLGNAGADDLTINASLASNLPIKTNDSYDIGSATLGLQNIYLGGTGGTTAIKGAASITTYTITTPGTVGVAGQALGNAGSGALEWIMSQTLTAAKSAAYVITDTDKVRTVLHTTGASNFDVTLPTAADNTNRIIDLKKLDVGVGVLTLKGEAAGETIDGISGTTGWPLTTQYTSVSVQSDGSVWHVVGNVEDKPFVFWKNTSTTTAANTASLYLAGAAIISRGTFTFSNGAFTVPKTGVYQICASFECIFSAAVYNTKQSCGMEIDSTITYSTSNSDLNGAAGAEDTVFLNYAQSALLVKGAVVKLLHKAASEDGAATHVLSTGDFAFGYMSTWASIAYIG